ncbi:response regulator transcription factor [Tabrizicola sp. BL-A-41-H6]|uniref:response regulator transcription factor n=1 Tax=Tabrizicola sp. BL-A-41-H6 TaxID=3421107 RepID=UPI003D664272
MSVIWLVDDDPGVLRALQRLLVSEGFDTRAFPDADAFLNSHDASLPGCALIDIGLPDLDGLALQRRLAAEGRACQIIFLTGQGSIPAAVQAIRGGAVDFLTKPVDAETLLAAIRAALTRDAEIRSHEDASAHQRLRLASLTPREREVMAEVASGRLNKQIAIHLGAAEKTIKVHRGRVMQKMGVRSVAELVTVYNRLRDGGAL